MLRLGTQALKNRYVIYKYILPYLVQMIKNSKIIIVFYKNYIRFSPLTRQKDLKNVKKIYKNKNFYKNQKNKDKINYQQIFK